MAKSILAIDDETMILDAMKIIFEEMGFEVTVCSDSRAGIAEALRKDHDLIVVDIRMPALNGAEVTEEIRRGRPDARILIVTAFPSDPLVQRALDAGAFALLKKPFEIAKVLDFLKE